MLAILGPIAPALGRRFSARADLPRLLAAIAAVALAISFLAIAACGGDADESPILEGHPTTIEVTSTAFAEGSDIPARFTCDGADISPPLQWTEVPQGTKSLALIVDDPDARGTWVHWVMYAIPNTAGELSEAVPNGDATAQGAIQGKNGFGRIGYGGPCPPGGSPHRYFFKIYALDAILDLEPGENKKNLLEAMDGRVLAEGRLMGRYTRR
jgi:Raf kinase inhibitor-like YbhB/YbcL family protein